MDIFLYKHSFCCILLEHIHIHSKQFFNKSGKVKGAQILDLLGRWFRKHYVNAFCGKSVGTQAGFSFSNSLQEL